MTHDQLLGARVEATAGARLMLTAPPQPLLLPARCPARVEVVTQRYAVILADPPWKYHVWGKPAPDGRSAESHYPTLDIEIIKSFPVSKMAARDCCLLMWVTWPTIDQAFGVAQSWGFEYKTCAFLWAKMNRGMYNRFAVPEDDANWYMGLGFWTRANTEACLLFTRGNPKRKENNVRQLIVSPIREHSRKPDQQYDYIERLVDGPYLELFARRKRPGWHSWGNEIESDVTIPAALPLTI